MPSTSVSNSTLNDNYLSWVGQHTPTKWWHDSAEETELDTGLKRGAIGVTTNPVLATAALKQDRTIWEGAINEVLARTLPPEAKAEALMQIAVTKAAKKLEPQFKESDGNSGFVCAQVNPARAGDRESMFAMAKRLHRWAPNIAVKLPATTAGLDVLEECAADGMNITVTVSFTVPQVMAIAERYRAGMKRARQQGMQPGKCFSVIMIGRLDDYLREVAQDNRANVAESDIRQSGLAVTKRAYQLYQEREYEAVLLVAALRGEYHLTEIVGADLLMSIHPSYQEPFVSKDLPREERIDHPVPADVIRRLQQMPDFVRAYEPDGMKPEEFISYGATQRTLSQFCEVGWKPMESYK